MGTIEATTQGWRLTVKGLVLDVDGKSGDPSRLLITADREFLWTDQPGSVAVRDDLLEHTFRAHEVQRVEGECRGTELRLRRSFRGAPWLLSECYRIEDDAIAWSAEVTLTAGDFRSCCVTLSLPWPRHQFAGHYGMEFWAAKENMPSAPHRYAGISLEYGEVTSGILLPALCCYRGEQKAGLLLTMPFDFRTPRLSFYSSYRDPELEVRFDWLALAPGRPARTSLLLHGTGGNWRPALGWLYRRFTEYFEPRSTLIDRLWGGHVSGWSDVPVEDARIMKELGMTWHEMHMHFPAYGNYHPEGVESWPIGHWAVDPRPEADARAKARVSVAIMRRTMAALHSQGIAALPYIQVSGDGDDIRLDPAFESSRARDLYGDPISTYFGCHQMNSDPALPFGQDMIRQIKGMVARYPEMDGVFLDQACYNYLDTAHDDGITAVHNRPAYMTGFNYLPHLELLSALLHPHKTIIGNGPFGIGIMKYIDAFMAEGSGWLCDHLQYYGLAKPMFFLCGTDSDRAVEMMFQRCLIHGAGFTSSVGALPYKSTYDLYRPLLERLFRRRWVFDPDPLALPGGFKGNLFQAPSGALVASLVDSVQPHAGARPTPQTVRVRAAAAEGVGKVTLHAVGRAAVDLPFSREDGAVQFDIPGDIVAGVAELGH
jgi:hypothetical protein